MFRKYTVCPWWHLGGITEVRCSTLPLGFLRHQLCFSLYKMITVSFTFVVFLPILAFLTHYLLSCPQLLLTYLIIVVSLEQ